MFIEDNNRTAAVSSLTDDKGNEILKKHVFDLMTNNKSRTKPLLQSYEIDTYMLVYQYQLRIHNLSTILKILLSFKLHLTFPFCLCDIYNLLVKSSVSIYGYFFSMVKVDRI